MEGEVSVRFTLLAGGNIGNISILSGETIFHNAAKAAVASASGMTLPKSLTDDLPLEINLGLEFKLKS
jgi:periplasmic protein TonB